MDIASKGYLFILSRVRYEQERQWRDEHLEEGIEHIRNGRNQQAIECFNVAKRFDSENIDIYIAKACALYNLVNLWSLRKVWPRPLRKSRMRSK